ncbi:hypothetical protein FXO38_24926 [Capsicum annuum]|nr:hypothetical protein FXO38_24926 [Capsicum annuum]
MMLIPEGQQQLDFEEEGDKGVHEGHRVAEKGVEGDYFNEAPTTVVYIELENKVTPSEASSAGVVAAGGEALADGKAGATAEAANIDVSDLSTENSSDSNHEDLFVEADAEFESDEHDEDINLRDERRTYQRKKRRQRIPNGPTEVPLGKVGLDLEFEETEIADKGLKGKVIGDETVYYRSDEYSMEFDLEYGLRRTDSRKVVYDKSAK